MAGGPYERGVRRLGRHADGMGDAAREHLVVAHEAGQDGQTRRVGRRPTAGPQGVGVEVPDGPRAGGGSRRAVGGVVELVEGARARVDHEGVAVARRLRPTLNRRVGPEGVGPRIALVGVLEGRRSPRGARVTPRCRGSRRGCWGRRRVRSPGAGRSSRRPCWPTTPALCGSTGSCEMLVFHTLSAGNIGQSGAPGSGVPAEAVPGTVSASPPHSSDGGQHGHRATSPPSSHVHPGARPYPTDVGCATMAG